jgi:soluble lytic murein transglycosylase-like protein
LLMEWARQLTTLEARAAGGRWAAVTGAVHNGLAGFGLLVLAFMVFDGGKFVPMATAQIGAAAFGKVTSDAPKADIPLDAERDPQHRLLAGYLARRYRVATDATADLVGEAYTVGQILDLDPLLILAVISVESRFNPIAESNYGAKGLMQVVPRFHQDKLVEHGGEPAVLDPRTNILVGAQILKEYIRRTGSLEAGLQLYAGATVDASQTYAQKVMAEKQRLQQTLKGSARSGTPT